MSAPLTTWEGAVLAGGRYHITCRLGEGGMGYVYLAEDRNLNTPVVIKVPRAAMLEDAEFAGRFARESRALVRLAHHSIVKILDVGEHAGVPFVVLQYLAGGSLQDRQECGLDRRPLPRPLHELTSWLERVAEALDFVHRQGYIHRDIKPGNILFDAEGHAYISDFGVAKALGEKSNAPQTVYTGTGMVLGTPQYMAPEMVLGQAFDGRVDQYALAVTVYEMVSGCFPFEGPTGAAILLKQSTEQPQPLGEIVPGLPPPLATAVQQALAKDPRQRFADCSAFARNVLQEVKPVTRPIPPLAPTGTQAFAETTKPDAVSVTCPACQKKLKVPASSAGKRLRCPKCQGPISLTQTASTKPPETFVAIRESGRVPTAPASHSPSQGKSVRTDGAVQSLPFDVSKRSPRRLRILIMGLVLALLLTIAMVWMLGKVGSFGFSPSLDKEVAKASAKASPTVPENQIAKVSGNVPPAVSENTPKWGDPTFTNSIGLQLVLIPRGKFWMGSPQAEANRSPGEEQHEVEITRAFYMGKYTVTVGQFREFLRDTNSLSEGEKDGQGGWGFNEQTRRPEGRKPEYTWKNPGWTQTDEHPVQNVSWNDAASFCDWLGSKEGKKHYRLPTEAEWEYACRANTTTRYYSGDSEESLQGVANIADAAFKRKYPNASWAKDWDDGYPFTAPVGRFRPNAFGLYDMHGNVWQWCADWYDKDYYKKSPGQDPQGPSAGVKRVLRGGSFSSSVSVSSSVSFCRSAYRYYDPPSGRGYDYGFRVVCVR